MVERGVKRTTWLAAIKAGRTNIFQGQERTKKPPVRGELAVSQAVALSKLLHSNTTMTIIFSYFFLVFFKLAA